MIKCDFMKTNSRNIFMKIIIIDDKLSDNILYTNIINLFVNKIKILLKITFFLFP